MRPGVDGELGVGQRHDAAVALGHAVHAEERLVAVMGSTRMREAPAGRPAARLAVSRSTVVLRSAP